MSIPKKTDLLTLDYSYLGEPFCNVAANCNTDSNGLDYSYLGEPFWSAPIDTTKRYFVTSGATANLSDTSNWSYESGGATGAPVPTSSESCYFDSNSFATGCTVTVNADFSCLAMDWTGLDQTVTLSSSVYDVYVYGALTFPASNLTVTFTGTAYWYLKATTSVNITMGATTGRTLNALYFDGVGGTWTSQDDMNIGSAIVYVFAGTWNTGGHTMTFGNIRRQYQTVNPFNINLSSSIVNITSKFEFASGSNLSLDAGVSTINISGGWQVYWGSFTYYNIVCSATMHETGVGSPTMQNFTYSPSAAGSFGIGGNITVNGEFTITGANSTNSRAIFRSSILGTAYTVTCNGTANATTITNCDFRDIIFAGSEATVDFSTVEIGDCGGNSGATFRAGETRYYHVGTGNYHDAKWYSATDGGGSAKGMPLPQDTAMFDANSFDGTATLTIANIRIGSLDMSGVDDAVTLAVSNTTEYYGSYQINTNITPAGSYNKTFYGRGTHSINGAGKYLYYTYFYLGTYTFLGDWSAGEFYLNSGTIDLNDNNLTTGNFTRFLGGTAYLGSGIVEFATSVASRYIRFETGCTVYPEGSTIKLSATGSVNLEFGGYGKTFNDIWFSGTTTGSYSTTGSNTFNDIKIDAGRTVKFASGTTTTASSYTIDGESGNLITIGATTSSAHTLALTGGGKVQAKYCNISYSTASPATTFYALDSTDGGNNTNWTFGTWLEPEYGSYILTGQDASFINNYALAAGYGSYALTGKDINLVLFLIIKLIAEQGSYSLTGHDTGLLLDRVMACEQGSHLLTGQDMGLFVSKLISCEQGSFVLTGQEILFIVDKLISLGHGSYVLSGQDSALLRSLKTSLENGGYSLTGENVSVLVSKMIECGYGNYSLAGQDTGLYKNIFAVFANGNYSLSGQETPLFVSKFISLENGLYGLTGFDAEFEITNDYVPIVMIFI